MNNKRQNNIFCSLNMHEPTTDIKIKGNILESTCKYCKKPIIATMNNYTWVYKNF